MWPCAEFKTMGKYLWAVIIISCINREERKKVVLDTIENRLTSQLVVSVCLASLRCCWSPEAAMIPMELCWVLWSHANSYQVFHTAHGTCRSEASFIMNPPHERRCINAGSCSFSFHGKDCFATRDIHGELLTPACTSWADPGQTPFTSLKLQQMFFALEFIHALQKGHVHALDDRLLVQLLQFQSITPSWWLMWFFSMPHRWERWGE